MECPPGRSPLRDGVETPPGVCLTGHRHFCSSSAFPPACKPYGLEGPTSTQDTHQHPHCSSLSHSAPATAPLHPSTSQPLRVVNLTGRRLLYAHHHLRAAVVFKGFAHCQISPRSLPARRAYRPEGRLYEPEAAKLISLPHFLNPIPSPFNDQPLLGEKYSPKSSVLQVISMDYMIF
jgi:hypothetical protein